MLKTYLYPHDFNGWVKQSYLSKSHYIFMKQKQIGFEKQLFQWHEKMNTTS